MIEPAPELTLSLVALAWKEGEQLRSCFKSLQPLASRDDAETLIVLDAQADEKTARVASEVADRVVVSPFVNFSVQRNRALDIARGRWVFFIDPDERCTPRLAREIERSLDSERFAAFRVSRRNILFGREVRHTGWWPDYQIRLLKRSMSRYDERREVHELPQVEGEIGTLREPLIHYNYNSWSQFVSKQWAYASLEARALDRAGRVAKPRSILGQPLRVFKRRFIDYSGYKDGLLGVALSVAMAIYAAETYRRLWVLQRARR